MAWILVLFGLAILVVAGDSLVKAAVNLALRIGISPFMVSLTVVAFGTSAPELFIVLSALADNAPDLAVGNIIGSNIANVLLVLGLPALAVGLNTAGYDTRKAFAYMITATVLFIALAFLSPFTWWHSVILLTFLTFILFDQLGDARRDSENNKSEPLEGVNLEMRGWTITFYLILGIIGLPIGATILVTNAELIARDFGVSETVIGLTLVAIGTSLPELATTAVAAVRKQADVALGNIIGSNMFNLLAIVGIAALVSPIPIAAHFLNFDLWVMLAASLVLIPFVLFRQNIGRIWGLSLTVIYLTYLLLVLF
ncbi:MAG: calcium/sodium antiporter, partial [Planktomarina sp.]|nr:calcium/sodium antiporter [Planktomarina sp.]